MRKMLFILFAGIFSWGCKKDKDGTVTVVPISPTELTATVISTTQVNLSWTDKSTNETGFKVQRKIGSGAYADIATVNKDITTYSDNGLTPNTTYTYRVYAYNSTGASLSYTNEATVTTKSTIPSTLNNGLVAYYPFTGNAGDSSGNNNHGTVNGATLTTDRFGVANKAYSFDGINDYIVATASQEMASQNKSISVWINQKSNFCQSEFLALGDASSTTWGCISGNGCLVLNYGRGCTNNASQSFSLNFSLQTWHHIVFVSSGINGNTSMYFDGQFIGNGTTASSVGECNKSKLYFGVDIFSLPEYLDGFLDDIRIYNRALTQEEITYLYNN